MTSHPKHLPADKRRAVIVQSVITLAATSNPSEITTAAIAEHMQLTQGSVFKHFSNKDAIWLAVMEWVAEELLQRVDNSAKDIDSPLAAIEAMFMSHVEFVSTYPGVPRILFGELQRAEPTAAKKRVQALIKSYSERLYVHIENGKHRGELSHSLDSSAVALLFLGMLQGLIMQSLLSGDPEHIRKNASSVFVIYKRGIVSS